MYFDWRIFGTYTLHSVFCHSNEIPILSFQMNFSSEWINKSFPKYRLEKNPSFLRIKGEISY